MRVFFVAAIIFILLLTYYSFLNEDFERSIDRSDILKFRNMLSLRNLFAPFMPDIEADYPINFSRMTQQRFEISQW